MNDEQLLRDRLHAEVATIDLPPDLAGTVAAGARRRRRARVAIAGAAVAVVAALAGGAVVLPDRADPVDPAAACRPPASTTGADQGPAPASTDISGWGFRGDPSLRRFFPATSATSTARTRLLLAQRLPSDHAEKAAHFVFALAVQLRGSWWVEVGIAHPGAATNSYPVDSNEPLRPLPAPVPGAQVSAAPEDVSWLDPRPLERVLVAFAPPGTGTVDYHSCPGETVQVLARGDALQIARLKGEKPGWPVPLNGRLTVTGAGGGTVYAGPVDDANRDVQFSFASWRTAMEKDDYDGWNLRFTGPGQRAAVTNLGRVRPKVFPLWRVTVICRGTGTTRVEVRGRSAEVPCDQKDHEVYRGAFDLRTDAVVVTATGAGANQWTAGYVGMVR